ncbi:WD repeat-containing protein 46 [Nomia melanderi]|uniref:WD repeat-containing protein 46 n=1 Tax=Nomia melanderi TaxID=2448451 RepID=UPI001304416A|nr:WD repeat-containing protein 46 [Nomia melanderi]
MDRIRKKYRKRPPIDEELLKKHSRGEGVNVQVATSKIKSKIQKQKLERNERVIDHTIKAAARAELLLTEDYGCLEADPGYSTMFYKQKQIAENADITSATKHFTLRLGFGCYRIRYTKNGRHLLLGGRKGHVAALDWVTKNLACEMNVMESVHDVSWLHIETMYAVAQKSWVYVYDNQGIELHCIKQMHNVNRLEFLPYHFLLASASREGYLTWLDTSIGQLVTKPTNTRLGNIHVMTQNPSNAVLCVGDSKGVVSMWSPNSKRPLAKMLCHTQAIRACAVHPHGTYMATSCPAGLLKVWDVRQLSGPVFNYRTRYPVQQLSYSQRGHLAMGMGNVVEIFRPAAEGMRPYLRHRGQGSVTSLHFCPFEDVLGVGTSIGVASLLVPGSGEANYDALESNPFQTKAQRREAEVKALLDKIQPELITMDPVAITEVDVPSLRHKVEEKNKLLFLKPKSIDYKPRRTKAKGKGGTAKVIKNKKILKDRNRKEFINILRKAKSRPDTKKNGPKKNYGVLNRFVSESR